MTTKQLPEVGPPNPTSFAHQAAKLSWACPIIVFGLAVFGGHVGSALVIDLIALLFILVGLISGIVALSGISRHGKKGILIPALIGIIINGFLLFIFVTNFVAARARAQQNTAVDGSSIVVAWSGHSTEAAGFKFHPDEIAG